MTSDQPAGGPGQPRQPSEPGSEPQQQATRRPGRSDGRLARPLEPWFAPFALVNGSAVGVVPILLPLVAIQYGVGHVGLVMGAFYLGALFAPLAGMLADRFHSYRLLTAAFAAASAVSLWLFPLAGPLLQLVLALMNGAGFAAAVTIANLLIVERWPKPQWNQRLGWLETALSVGQGITLILAAWLSELRPPTALLLAAIVPAAAVPLSVLVPAMRPRTDAHQASARDGAAVAGRGGHQLASWGHVGEWGPASPSRVHHLHRPRPSAGTSDLLRGGFGWLLAAWVPSYAGAAIVFALYPVLFRAAFGIAPHTSALAFAVIVFVSLPLFVLAGRVSQRRGPAAVMAGGLAARVLLLVALTIMAAVGHIPAALPLTAFAGIMFTWSFLSVASPGLTGQLAPDREGDAQGLLNAGSGVAGLVGSVAGGFAAGRWGYAAALGIGAAAIAIGLGIFALTSLRRAAAGRSGGQ